MRCNVCDEEIEYCDDCSSAFEVSDTIYCGNEIGREHLCVDCFSYEEGEVEE